MIIIVPIVAAVVALTNAWRPLDTIAPRTWVALALSAVATGASWLCYFQALKLGDAARVAPIDKLSVVLVAVFGVMFLREHLTARNWLGVALIAGGAVLVAARR